MKRILARYLYVAPVLTSLVLWVCMTPTPCGGQDAVQEPLLITLEADSTSVNDILKILASRSGFNIVTSPEVQGRMVSIRLGNTPFEEALNLVVRAAGLGYERIGNSILVADPNKLATQTGLTTQVFELDYADPEEVRAALEVVTKSVSADHSRNAVVIRESRSLVEQAAAIIEQLDKKPGQVLFEARVVEVNTSDLAELGIDWEKVTKISTVLTEGRHGTSPKGELPEELGYFKADEYTDFFRQSSTLEVALDFLITKGNARLLSHSKVVTLDNQEAEIFVGETVPVVITSLGSSGGAGGTFQTIQLEKIDVGVKLNITPRISPDGYISTIVEPEVSSITQFVGPDDDLPQTATRRAKSVVRVRDGEKIYLGGLLSEHQRMTVKKVPILGSIPLLGYLFQHRRDDTIRTDLVIEITPRIIGDDGSALPKSGFSDSGE